MTVRDRGNHRCVYLRAAPTTAAACRKGRAALRMRKWVVQLLPKGVAGLLSPAGH